ncbi:hypothetical protein MLP_18230 [Microlunatus phosphovorus NM-1]|uniref:Uncharacterized protein n=1 Tax=Microlunatus phosphovorus (strain ATCC 700054 / DSM 10555 / JCM 9379 / NBRC 101784 / NCIMB 13414 / VKM Ac-1990 / NM-1) TaxID=1032480 RepID=F5XSF6_MICPN|nr:hypothetical protein MLP_18230 [Microlunatus phosphovorus NM-1]
MQHCQPDPLGTLAGAGAVGLGRSEAPGEGQGRRGADRSQCSATKVRCSLPE